jgi:hypothetical protein
MPKLLRVELTPEQRDELRARLRALGSSERGQPLRRATIYQRMEEDMSNPAGGDDSLHELEIEVEAELNLAESSRPEEVIGLPSSEWLFDPTDVQREEAGLRSLLGAIEEMEGDSQHDRTSGS